jgi:hypothetical protein
MVGARALRRDLSAWFNAVELFGMRTRSRGRVHGFLRALDRWNLRLRLVPPRRRESLRVALGATPEAAITPDDVVIARGQLAQATTLFAVCRRPRRL